MRWLFRTDRCPATLLVRLALGGVMFYYGARKVLGLFGGAGLPGSMNALARDWGLSSAIATVILIAELVGAIFLLLGFIARVAAAGIVVDLALALYLVHVRHLRFMDWFGNRVEEGVEFHVLALVIGIILVVKGAGPLSIDRPLAHDVVPRV